MLSEAILPQSVVSIEADAFRDCRALRNLQLPQALQSIGDAAFRCCQSLEEFDVPESVTSFGKKVLYDCTELKSVTCHWTEPIKTKDVVNTKSTVLRVPSQPSKLDKKYKKQGWKFKKVETF